MRVYGIDFTSAPSARKPLTCALCRLDGERLLLDALCAFESLECFGNLLCSEGPWVAGMDFPFGLPRGFLEPLAWPTRWERYVTQAASLPRARFKELVREAAAAREAGQRHARRRVDRLAGSQSPMNVVRPPVGLMFHAGAPPLLASGATVVPVHAGDPQRVAVEAYPRLVARALIGARPYKDEAKPGDGEPRTRARVELVRALGNGNGALGERYGLVLEGLDAFAAELADEPSADRVDAVMCAVQAAWAWTRREQGYGLPADADPAEGWIADPATARPT